MTIKIKKSELRALIRSELMNEASLSNIRGSFSRYNFKKCRLDSLKKFEKSDGTPAFDSAGIEGFESIFAGAPPAACTLINTGLGLLSTLMGYTSGGGSTDVASLDIEKLVKRAGAANREGNNDYFEGYSEQTNLFFPNMSKELKAQTPEYNDKNKLKSALMTDLKQNEVNARSLSNVNPKGHIYENYDVYAGVFRFKETEDYKELRKKVYDAEKSVLDNKKMELPGKVAEEMRTRAFNNVIDENDPVMLLNTIFEKSEKDLRSVDAKVVEILDDPEVKKLMIVLQTIK